MAGHIIQASNILCTHNRYRYATTCTSKVIDTD